MSYTVTELRPCGLAWLTNDTTEFINNAAYSDGQVFAITKQDIANVMAFWPTLYQSGLVFESGQIDCVNTPQLYYFPVESHATTFTLTASVFNATIHLISPDQTHITNYTKIGSDYFINLVQVKKPQAGMWTVFVAGTQSTIGCRVQVRVQSDIQVFYGFLINSTQSDFPVSEPAINAGWTNYMAAHVTGLAKPGASMGYVQLFNGNGTLARAAQMMHRDNCAYEWASQPFVCPTYYFLISANGIDENGYPWYRVRTALCIPKGTPTRTLRLPEQ